MRPPSKSITFLSAMNDDLLLGKWFKSKSWDSWRVFTKGLFGEPMTDPEATVFRQHTGRDIPTGPAREAHIISGRRSGKSLYAGSLACWAATCRDYRPYLKPGERAVVMVLAADKNQARVVFDYISGFFDQVPMLAGLVESKTAESIDLTNRVTIRVQTASFRSLRGRTVAFAVLDEVAFWMNENSSNPDFEIIAALRPSMVTIPGAMLIAISSPYARRGVLWDAFQKHYGKDNDKVLVWKSSTVEMNPSVNRTIIEEAYAADPAAAAAEYGGDFRTDLEAFISQETVESATVKGRTYLPFDARFRHVAFADPAGGSGQDSFTLAIARAEGKKSVLCRVVEFKPPFSPEETTAACAEILLEYGLTRVVGDHYGGDWPKERFRFHGVQYSRADQTKSDYYRDMLPLLNGQRVELLDHPRTLGQLLALERSTSRLGKDTISHPPQGHDDLVNSMAGALVLVQRNKMLQGYTSTIAKLEPVEPFFWKHDCGTERFVDPGSETAPFKCFRCEPGWTWASVRR